MDLRLVLVLCAFVATQAASTSDILSGQCATQCQSSELNEYDNGKTYIYKYSARTLVNSWNTDVDLKGDVLITRLSSCDYALELRNVAIKGIPNANPLENALKANSFKFTWIDGKISDVCHHPEEEDWVINVKKSIISSLQLVNSGGYSKTVERDILGDCETIYNQQDLSSENIVIQKTKNMATCRNHHDEPIAAAIEAIWTPGEPEYQCKQVWSPKYVLRSVKCGHVAATQTNIMANLTLDYVKTESKVLTSELSQFRRTNLHAHHVAPVKKSVNEVSSLLVKLCKSVENEVKPVATEQLQEFVDSLKALNYPELKQVWQSLESKQFQAQCQSVRIRSIFADSLHQCRTGSVLKLLVNDLAAERRTSEMKLRVLMHSLIYKVDASEDTMDAVISFLQSNRPIKISLFGITNAIQKFYEVGQNRKLAHQAFDLVLKRFNQANEQDKILMARALTNIHFDHEKLVSALEQYIERGHPELRVVAIEILQDAALCKQSIVSKLRKLVTKTNEPNEVRVRALWYLLRCADEQIVNELKSYIVSARNDEHFVSYADSYLRNALQTMNPDKQIVKETAGLGQSTWQSPKATFARNIEFSRITREGLIGFSYEADSIVENGKQVPTWIVMNASIPVRRENSINFEMGVRQENLEKLTSKLMERMNKIDVEQWKQIAKEAVNQKSTRPITKQIRNIVGEFMDLVNENGKLSVYIKVNGVTVYYWDGKFTNPDVATFSATYPRWVRDFGDNRMFETAFGWIFVDYNVHVPMVSGLLLRYKNIGSFVPGYKAQIKKQSTDVRSFGLYPNFALEFRFGRALILHKPIAGEFRRSTFTSTAFVKGQRKHTTSDKESWTISIDASEPEMELFRMKSVRVIRSPQGEEVKDVANNFQRQWCSTEYTEKIFGLALCFEAKSEIADLPINKNFDVRCYAKKTEKALKSYEFVAEQKQGYIRLTIDTPGSKINRRVEVVMKQEGDKKPTSNSKGLWALTINTPIRNVQGTAKYAFPSGQQWFVQLEAESDRRAHAIRLTLEPPNSNKQKVLNFMVNSPLLREKIDYDLTFAVESELVLAQVHVNAVNKRARLVSLKLKRSVDASGKKTGSVDFELNNKQSEKLFTINSEGYFTGSYPAISSAAFSHKVEYRRRQGKMEKVNLSAILKIVESAEYVKTASTKLELQTTQFPKINGVMEHKMFMKLGFHYENDVEIRWGRDYESKSTKNTINLHQKSEVKQVNGVYEFENEFIVENKAKQFNHKVHFTLHSRRRSYDNFKLIAKHVDLSRPETQHGFAFEHKYASKSEGISSLSINLPPTIRSIKTTYSTENPKFSLIYKVDRSGSISGYHASASLNRQSDKKIIIAEVSTHPENKPVFKSELDFSRKPEKAFAIVKVSVYGANVVSGEYKRTSEAIEGKLVLPKVGHFETNVDWKQRKASIVTKHSKGWEHDIKASFGSNKMFKAATTKGYKWTPDVEISCDQKAQIMKMMINSNSYSFSSDLSNWQTEPKFNVEFHCDHGDFHKSEFQWLKSNKMIKSSHKTQGQELYNCELTHEKKSGEYRTVMTLKGHRDNFVVGYKHLFDTTKRTSKLEVNTKYGPSEASFTSDVALPTHRQRFAQVKDLPKVNIKANMKHADRILSVNLVSDKIVKLHIQREVASQTVFIFETKVDDKKTALSGKHGDLTWNIDIIPKGSRKSVNWVIKKSNMLSKSEMIVEDQGQQWSVIGTSEHTQNGKQYWNGEIATLASKKVTQGPHKFTIKDKEGSQLTMNYKMQDKLEFNLKAVQGNAKIIEVIFTGDKKDRRNVSNMDGTLILSSEKMEALRKPVTYQVNYEQNGRTRKVNLEKKGDRPLALKMEATIAREGSTVAVKLSGRNKEGKQQQLTVDYKRSDKITFNARLVEQTSEKEKVQVSIPLANVAKFIGSEYILNLDSKQLNTRAIIELKAPASNLITGLVEVDVNGQEWVRYNMNVDDGKSLRFYGMDKMNVKDFDKLAMVQKLTFQRKLIFTQQVIVGKQDAVNFELDVPVMPFKVQHSVLLQNNEPKAFGKYCWKSCTTMESKFKLGQQGNLVMTISPENSKPVEIDGKWNLQEGKELGSMNVRLFNRRYGHEWSRKVVDNKNAVYTVKLNLPERVMMIEVTKKVQNASPNKFTGSYIIKLEPKENSKPVTIILERTINRSQTNFKGTHVITLNHHSLAKPIQIVTDIDYLRSKDEGHNILGFKSQNINVGVNYEGEKEHDINANMKWEMVDSKLNYNWRIWHKENKVDFGCKGFYNRKGNWQLKTLNQAQDYTCHWVDRQGQRKEVKRDQKISFVTLSGIPRITFHDNMEHPLTSYFYNGTFHFAEAVKDATIDFDLKNGQKLRLKAFMDTSLQNKCLELTSYMVNEPDQKYGLRSCLNMKPRSGDSFYLLQLVSFTGNTQLINGEKTVDFSIKRMQGYANDYLIALKWDTSKIGDLSLKVVEVYETMQTKRSAYIVERDAEVREKLGFVKNHLGSKVNVLREQWHRDVDELKHEMRPEFKIVKNLIAKAAPIYRSRRSIAIWRESNQVDLTSPMSYEWRVYDAENGHLELVLRNVEATKVPRFVVELLRKNSMI